MHTGIKVHVVVPCTPISLALSGADVTVISLSRFMNLLKLPIKLTYTEYSYMVSYFSFLVFLSQILAGVILEVLVEAFPESFGEEAQRAWSKLMGVVYWHVTRVYSEIGWASTE